MYGFKVAEKKICPVFRSTNVTMNHAPGQTVTDRVEVPKKTILSVIEMAVLGGSGSKGDKQYVLL